MTKKKTINHPTTETNINVEGSSEIILECYRSDKKGSQLKIRVISEGYDSKLNVRFPRDLKEEGALYSVQTIQKAKGNYYLVKGNITKIDGDLDSVIAKNSGSDNEQHQTILTEEKASEEITISQDLREKENQLAEASLETTSPERLRELANQSIELACQVANNPHCPPDLLVELALNEERLVRQAVTNNPNTPKNTLLKLGAEFPEEFLDNPVFDLLLLENPNFLAEIPKSTLESIVKLDKFPQPFLTWVLDNSNDNDRLLMALLSNPNLTRKHLERLSSHKNPLIAQDAKLHINCDKQIKNTEDEIKKALNQSALSVSEYKKSHIFIDLYLQGIFKQWEETLWAKSINFCFKKLKFISYFTLSVRQALAYNSNTPSEILKKLANDSDKIVRKLVAENPQTPISVSRFLQKHFYGEYSSSFISSNYNLESLVKSIRTRGGASGDEMEYMRQSPRIVYFISDLEELAKDLLDEGINSNRAQAALDDLEDVLSCAYKMRDKLVVYGTHNKYPCDSSTTCLGEGIEPDLGRFILFFSPYAELSDFENNFRSNSWLERYAIAQNQKTPENILCSLAKDGNKLVRNAAIANNRNTSVNVLEQLATNSNNSIRRIVVNNPSTPVSVLEKLARDSDKSVRQMVANNRNTPISVLEKLATDSNNSVCQAVANNPNTPVNSLISVLEKLAGDSDNSVRQAVANNPNTPVSVLEKLATDVDNSVRWAVKENPNTPVNVSDKLVCDPKKFQSELQDLLSVQKEKNYKPMWVYYRMKEKFALNLEQLKLIAKSLGYKEGWATVKYKEAELVHIEELLNNDDDVLIALLRNPQLSQEILVQLTKHKNPKIVEEAKLHINWNEEIENPQEFIRKALRKNNFYIEKVIIGSFSAEMISSQWAYDLLSSTSGWVRSRVASNPNTPVRILEKLATDSDEYVRRSVASNPNTPVKILEKLATDDYNWVRCYVARNPNTPVRILEKLATDSYYEVVRYVAINPNTPVTILDDDDGVYYVASNPNTPVKILEKLATDSDEYVRMNVARNPNTPVKILEKLATDSDEYVRRSVASNPNTPVKILEKLATDSYYEVVRNVASNPNTPVTVLEKLATNSDDNGDFYVARNPNTPVRILKKLATNSDDNVRRSVASNPNTPVTVLEKLATDSDDWVRISVASNPNTPATVLKKLATDSDDGVRISVASNTNTSLNIKIKIFNSLAESTRSDFGRLAVFLSPYAETSHLAKNFRSTSWLERWAIAQNPNTPDDTLSYLVKDANKLVRSAAELNIKQRQDGGK